MIQCIRPNIAFDVPAHLKPKQYTAQMDVQLRSNGEIQKIQFHPSGLTGFDVAVQRAVKKCDPFPRVPGIPIPSEIHLNFDPVDQN